MTAFKSFFCLNLVVLLVSCGIQVKEASLYDGQEVAEAPPKPAKISLAVEPVIFEEDGTNFWVTDNPACTTGSVVEDVTHSGKAALKINWNRDPSICEWAGFGIGWDDWAGKDLTEVYDHTAIEMYVRSQEGKMFGLPIVLTLEDYSGNMAWSYTGNKYFERYYIDEEWQKVTIPLNTFDLEEDGIDLGNVKQLMFELQQAGGIYLDDVQIVFYEPEVVEPWLADAPKPQPVTYPLQLFDDAFINNNGWGLHEDHCQKIELTTATKSEGNKSIHATWDKSKEDCYLVAIGVSWNQWFSTDISAAASTMMVEFDVKSAGGSFSELPVNIGFEDYERRTSFAPLKGEYVDGGNITSEWKRVRVPLTAITGNADFSNLKQLMIKMEKTGEVYLDNIRLVRNQG